MFKFREIAAALLVFVMWGCVEQETDRPSEDDKKIIKQNLLTAAPDMKYKVNAELENYLVYLGTDVDKATIVPGEQFKVTHYIKVLKKIPAEYKTFFHISGPKNYGFINADHNVIGGRYPVTQWKENEIIRDEHSITLPKEYHETVVSIYFGLWSKGDERMKVVKGQQDGQNRVVTVTLPVAIAKAEAPKQLIATKIAKAIKLDGKLDEEAWSKAVSSGLFVDTMTGAPVAKKTEAKALWDDKNLYLAFTCEDEDIWSSFNKRDDKLWTEEAVEAFIDANGDGKDYIELQVNPHGTIFDSYLPSYRANQNEWNSTMKVAVSVEGTVDKRNDKDKSWTVEMVIPWENMKGKGTYELKTPPQVGEKYKVNFFRMDKSGGKDQIASGWSAPMVGDFHKLDRFGSLVFGDEAGKAPAPTTAAATSAPTQTMAEKFKQVKMPTRMELRQQMQEGALQKAAKESAEKAATPPPAAAVKKGAKKAEAKPEKKTEKMKEEKK